MNKLGVLGRSLSHSFSQRYFTEKFEKEAIKDYQFFTFDVENLDQFLVLLDENPDIVGLSVTIPYKEEIIHFLNELDDAAREMGAINVVCVSEKEGKRWLKGHNTDYIGFTKTLSEAEWQKISHAIILGNGGASKAIQYALQKQNVSFQIVSRRSGNGLIAYDEITSELVQQSQLIINTTSLGMFPKVDEKPLFPYEKLTPQHSLIDIVYNPEMTAFLTAGAAQGASVYGGMKMLIEQAEAAWKLYGKNKEN